MNKLQETQQKILKEFRKDFINGSLPYDMPGGHGIQEAESWVEADPEELEGFIQKSLEEMQGIAFEEGYQAALKDVEAQGLENIKND